jgi:hypothetical protein
MTIQILSCGHRTQRCEIALLDPENAALGHSRPDDTRQTSDYYSPMVCDASKRIHNRVL